MDDSRPTTPKLDSLSFGLVFDAWGKLVLIDGEGNRYVGVEPIRAFPFSDPERGISICDEEGRELVWIDSLDDLSRTAREAVVQSLAAREFMPKIEKIVQAPSEAMPADWEVVTDRGLTRFTLNGEDDIRRLDRYRALIVDAQGIRYLIPDTRKLDVRSRRALERYFF